MKIDALLSISRTSLNVIRIRVRDVKSRGEFLQLEMNPSDFAMAVTGLSETPCKGVVVGLENVGKDRVSESRFAVCPIHTYDREILRKWLIENCQEPGWKLDSYLGTQQSVVYNRDNDGVTLNYRVYKYVEEA